MGSYSAHNLPRHPTNETRNKSQRRNLQATRRLRRGKATSPDRNLWKHKELFASAIPAEIVLSDICTFSVFEYDKAGQCALVLVYRYCPSSIYSIYLSPHITARPINWPDMQSCSHLLSLIFHIISFHLFYTTSNYIAISLHKYRASPTLLDKINFLSISRSLPCLRYTARVFHHFSTIAIQERSSDII